VAEVIWTEPALDQLNEAVAYIALDKAATLVEKVLSALEHLPLFPEAGQ
jgi:toxin ParE1/3/4